MRATAAALLTLAVQLAVWLVALLCVACSAAQPMGGPRCVTLYRGPDLGEQDRPYFATVRCGHAPEVIVCRSPRPLPNDDCRPEPAEAPPDDHRLDQDR